MATPQIESMLPITEAAARYRLPVSVLHQEISLGTIRAAMLNGSLLVSENDCLSRLPKSERPEYKKYAHLRGIGISLREAARKYRITPDNLSRWVKSGYISRLGMAGVQKILIDEADVAYCAEVYHQNPGQGKRIFSRDGTPYHPKS